MTICYIPMWLGKNMGFNHFQALKYKKLNSARISAL